VDHHLVYISLPFIYTIYGQWTKGVPIEVVPMAFSVILLHLKTYYPSAAPNLRMVCLSLFYSEVYCRVTNIPDCLLSGY
jgi:hypothetical protein